MILLETAMFTSLRQSHVQPPLIRNWSTGFLDNSVPELPGCLRRLLQGQHTHTHTHTHTHILRLLVENRFAPVGFGRTPEPVLCVRALVDSVQSVSNMYQTCLTGLSWRVAYLTSWGMVQAAWFNCCGSMASPFTHLTIAQPNPPTHPPGCKYSMV